VDRKWWTLLAVCVATFMLLLDVTVVNVALPYIERDLHSSFTDLQWVVDAYALTLAALLLTAGSLGDRLGRRLIFVVGLVIFTAASALCGFATSPLMLNLSRGLQGIGGGFMFATALALLAAAFRGPERGTALGLWGATTGAAVAVGPLVGGVLVQAIGWEAIFFVNVPIGIGAIAMTLAKVDESRDPSQARIDWIGTVLFSAGLFLLVFGLIRGNPESWNGTIIAVLVGAGVLLVAFVVVELRLSQPMLDLGLFRIPTFVGASVAAFVLSAAMFAMFLYLTLYIQNILGYSALESGLRFMPNTALAFLMAPISGKLAERVGARWFIGAGLVFVAAALVLFGGRDVGDDWTALLPGMILGGIGIGMVNAPLATTAVGVVEPQRSGMASGINSTARQVGIATGTALYGAIIAGVIDGRAQAFGEAVGRSQAPAGAQGSFSDFIVFGAYKQLGGPALEPGRAAFLDGMNQILLIGGIIALVGAVLSFALIRPKDFVEHAHAPEAVPAD
jgi:EmrB/QacA subfamily drug resistance transporter